MMQRAMQFLMRHGGRSDARVLEWYPPFWPMRIKVVEASPDWRRIHIRLPLTFWARNPGGSMFGGYQTALADPIAALSCARVFPGHSVWTRAITVEFDHEGSTDLELRFDFPPDLEAEIRATLAAKGRATPTFEYGYYLADGRRCSLIRNTVAIRPRGYSR